MPTLQVGKPKLRPKANQLALTDTPSSAQSRVLWSVWLHYTKSNHKLLGHKT